MKKQPAVPKVPTFCLYRLHGEPEKDVGKQELWPTRDEVEYKVFPVTEVPAARERGWFDARAVREFLQDDKAKSAEMPTDDKAALIAWAKEHKGLTLDKRKTLENLIAEVRDADSE
jgi:hypothetical protein